MMIEGFFLLGIFAAFALLQTLLAFKEWQAWYYLRHDSHLVPVEVKYHWVGYIGIFPHYYIIYQFETPDDLLIEKHAEISAEQYQRIMAGKHLRVRYARRRPDIFRLQGQSTDQTRWTLGALMTWGLTVFMALLALA